MAMSPETSWDDLRVFLAVRRSGSHAAAARALDVDATTVGRRMTALERALGAKLFDRTPAGLVATDAGTRLFARAERVEAEVLACERELGGVDARASGTVRVTAGDGLVHFVLAPAAVDLQRSHPGITLVLHGDTRSLDLSRREADVALRLARPKEPSLVTKRVGAMRFGLFASRAWLDRNGTPRKVTDLGGQAFIGFEAELDGIPQMRWLKRTVPDPRWVVRATTTTAQVFACAAGLGVALLADFTAAADPRLVPVLPRLATPTRAMYITVHEDVRKRARVEAVVRWLEAVVARVARP